MKENLFKAYFALITTAVLWASAFVGIRYAVSDFPPEAMALLRFIFASITLAVIYYFHRDKRTPMSTREIIRVILAGFVGIACYNTCLNLGEVAVTASTSSFLISQAPILTTIFAYFFLKERIQLLGLIGLAISVTGVTLIFTSNFAHFSQHASGIIFVCLAVLCSATYVILQKPLLYKHNPFIIGIYIIWSGTFFLLVFAPMLVQHLSSLHLGNLLTIFYLGLFPGGVAYLTWSYALSKVPAAKAVTALYLMPLLSTIFGWLLLGELPAVTVILGGMIAVCGALLVNLQKVQIAKKEIMTKTNTAANDTSN